MESMVRTPLSTVNLFTNTTPLHGLYTGHHFFFFSDIYQFYGKIRTHLDCGSMVLDVPSSPVLRYPWCERQTKLWLLCHLSNQIVPLAKSLSSCSHPGKRGNCRHFAQHNSPQFLDLSTIGMGKSFQCKRGNSRYFSNFLVSCYVYKLDQTT